MVKKNFITFILCVVLIFTTFFSFLYIATKSEHTHAGKECPICLEIHTCRTFLNSISNAGWLSTALFVVLFIRCHSDNCKNTFRRFTTLVSLKIKLVI